MPYAGSTKGIDANTLGTRATKGCTLSNPANALNSSFVSGLWPSARKTSNTRADTELTN